jgi:CubicO group peptidase (beta-lactamase class C family)
MDTITSDRFSKHINELLDTWHTPGAAVAVVRDGKVQSKGFGKASLDPAKPVTADTLFDIASSSKSLTAASVALLVADNERYPQVQWDSKMSNLLPEDFVMAEQSYTDDITVEDILCHRTGLPS